MLARVPQVGFRWAGEANIALAIEPIVSLGTLLRMVPKVSNLRVPFCAALGKHRPICNAHVLQLASAIVHVGMAPKVSTLRGLLVLPLTASSQSAGCCAPSRSRLRQPHRIDWPEPCCIYCSKACKIRREPFATPQISGVFRIVMKPLIDDIPVVAGMVVAMKAPPQACFCFELHVYRFRNLDLGTS